MDAALLLLVVDSRQSAVTSGTTTSPTSTWRTLPEYTEEFTFDSRFFYCRPATSFTNKHVRMADKVDVSRWPAPIEGESHEQLKIMLAGEPYIAVDPYLCRIREDMANKMYEYNLERSGEKRGKLLEEMATLRKTEGVPQNTHIMTPFTFEYVSRSPSTYPELFCLEMLSYCEKRDADISEGFNLNLGYDVYIAPNGQFIDVNESERPFPLRRRPADAKIC